MSRAGGLVLGLICLITAASYSPILFNFFVGDDFVHLIWLKRAMVEPELILRNFHTSWLQLTTTAFYRPLISVFLSWDYFLWKTNAIGFHITNLVFHVVATIGVYFVAQGLVEQLVPPSKKDLEKDLKNGLDPASIQSWIPAFAATIFGVYPLHPEAVSWITGRVDVVATAFYMLSLWGYLEYRKQAALNTLVSVCLCMVLAFFSKEMAFTLPIVITAFELFVTPKSDWKSRLRPIALLWAILIGFLALRSWALGTVVGGYDNSFLPSDWKAQFRQWWQGAYMFLVPLNKAIPENTRFMKIIWIIFVLPMLGSAIYTAICSDRWRKLLLFCVTFLLISFAPVFKLFTIGDDLQSSRLAYLPSAALSILLAAAALSAPVLGRSKRRIAGAFSIFCLVCLCFNNSTWIDAGETVNSIRKELNTLYSGPIQGDPQVLILSLPDNINGAYACRNALDGMTKSPQLCRDIHNCLALENYEPIIPFGFLKHSLFKAKDEVNIYRWNQDGRKLSKVEIPQDETPFERTFEHEDLRDIMEANPVEHAQSKWNTDGSLEFESATRKSPKLFMSVSIPCFKTDILSMEVTNFASETPKGPACLLFRNNLAPSFDDSVSSCASLVSGTQTLYFPLTNMPQWTLGGTCRELSIQFPRKSHLMINKVSLIAKEKMMPVLNFENSGFMGSKGYLHLSRTEQMKDLLVDAHAMPGATKVVLEIAQPNRYFESQNTAASSPSSLVMKTIDAKISDTIKLERSLFPSVGIYQVRAYGIDAKGNKMGLASDHIVVAVDS